MQDQHRVLAAWSPVSDDMDLCHRLIGEQTLQELASDKACGASKKDTSLDGCPIR